MLPQRDHIVELIKPKSLVMRRVGVASGVYIFKQPLDKYWREQQRLAAEAGTHPPVTLSDQQKGPRQTEDSTEVQQPHTPPQETRPG